MRDHLRTAIAESDGQIKKEGERGIRNMKKGAPRGGKKRASVLDSPRMFETPKQGATQEGQKGGLPKKEKTRGGSRPTDWGGPALVSHAAKKRTATGEKRPVEGEDGTENLIPEPDPPA